MEKARKYASRREGESVLSGLVSTTLLNTLSRIASYAKHVILAATIGLSVAMDACYVALSVIGVSILMFADAFSSVGVPGLVKAREEGGDSAFRGYAGSVMVFAIFAAAASAVVLYAAYANLWLFAPGFPPSSIGEVKTSLLIMLPVAVLTLPYCGIASVLRSARRYRVVSEAELAGAMSGLVAVPLLAGHPYMFPLSVTAGFMTSFAYLSLSASGYWSLRSSSLREVRVLLKETVSLMPSYVMFHMLAVTDRLFASYLPLGSVSAITYAATLATMPPTVFSMESVLMTSFAESGQGRVSLERSMSLAAAVSVPFAVYLVVYGDRLVSALLERGAFGPEQTGMTSKPMTMFALALPAFFLWPLCYRMMQVLGKRHAVGVVAALSVPVNAIGNALFMGMGMGASGLALSTSVCAYGVLAAALKVLKGSGAGVRMRGVFLLGGSSLVAAAASASVLSVFGPPSGLFWVIVHGLAYLSAWAGIMAFAPGDDMDWIRGAVLLPAATAAGGRLRSAVCPPRKA